MRKKAHHGLRESGAGGKGAHSPRVNHPNHLQRSSRPTSRELDRRGLPAGAQQSGAQRGAHGNGQLIHHSFGLHSLNQPNPLRPFAGREKPQPERGRHLSRSGSAVLRNGYLVRKRVVRSVVRMETCLFAYYAARTASEQIYRHGLHAEASTSTRRPSTPVSYGIHGLVSMRVSIKMSSRRCRFGNQQPAPTSTEPPKKLTGVGQSGLSALTLLREQSAASGLEGIFYSEVVTDPPYAQPAHSISACSKISCAAPSC